MVENKNTTATRSEKGKHNKSFTLSAKERLKPTRTEKKRWKLKPLFP